MTKKDVDEILKILGKGAERKVIERELNAYIDEFGLTMSEAKKLVLRKHGAGIDGPGEAVQKSVKELTPMDKNVNLLCRVVFVTEKTIKADGKEKDIISGILGDESGTVPFTHWEKGDLSLEKGDVIRIESAYITEYRDEPQVNIGNRGKVTKRDRSEMPEFKGRGSAAGDPGEAVQKSVKELTPMDKNVDMVCRVVFVTEKTIKADGKEKDIISGILGDESGTVPFTHWEKGDLSLEKGDVIRIESAYITEYRDEPQVNIGNRGKVTKLDRSEMPEFKGGGAGPARACKVSDLGESTGNISVAARILNLETREVTVGGEKKEVMSGLMADETGKVSFTCWGVAKVKEGDVVRVNTGYLRKWRGMPQLNFDAANVEKVKEDMPKAEALMAPSTVTVEHLSRIGGMVDASVDGVILDVREGSGLVFRCPECNRVLQKNICRVHMEVEGIPDLRIKAIVDDGTGAINAIMNRDITERLLGKSLKKCMDEAKKAMDQSIIRDQLFQKLVAMPVRVSGNVTSDDFGLMLIATSTEFRSEDPQERARKMLEEVNA